jgi:hypothetical protein
MFDVIGGFIDKNIEEHLEQNDYSVEFEPRVCYSIEKLMSFC